MAATRAAPRAALSPSARCKAASQHGTSRRGGTEGRAGQRGVHCSAAAPHRRPQLKRYCTAWHTCAFLRSSMNAEQLRCGHHQVAQPSGAAHRCLRASLHFSSDRLLSSTLDKLPRREILPLCMSCLGANSCLPTLLPGCLASLSRSKSRTMYFGLHAGAGVRLSSRGELGYSADWRNSLPERATRAPLSAESFHKHSLPTSAGACACAL